MRLLIVEDETRIAELVQGALARAGFAVDTVGLCAEARAALKVASYDAAIVDLGLPRRARLCFEALLNFLEKHFRVLEKFANGRGAIARHGPAAVGTKPSRPTWSIGSIN